MPPIGDSIAIGRWGRGTGAVTTVTMFSPVVPVMAASSIISILVSASGEALAARLVRYARIASNEPTRVMLEVGLN